MSGPSQRSAPIEFRRVTLPSGAVLHLNWTPKLKTILVKGSFAGNLDESTSARALLPMVLRRGTRRFPDMKAIHRRLEELYGTSLLSDVQKVGEWHSVKFRLEAVNDRFLPGGKGVFGDAAAFLHELIHDPRLVGGTFDPEVLEQEKHNLRRTIEGLIDDKAHYALERCIREMCADEPFRRYELGEVADLPGITAEGLSARWREWVSRSPFDLYISGDIDLDAMEELAGRAFGGGPRRDLPLSPAPRPVPVGKPRSVVESLDVNQGKLVLGFRHGITYREGDLEAMVMMNGVLGSFSHSKLFQNVREKASLAYDVHSVFEKTKGLLLVVGGIAIENHDRALAIMEEQVEALKEGQISDDELLATRESFQNHLILMEDSPADLMEVDWVWKLHGREFDLPAYRRALLEVDRDRIAAAARRLQLDTIYFLRN